MFVSSYKNKRKKSSDSKFANENERPSQRGKYWLGRSTQEQKDAKNRKQREQNQKLPQEQKDAKNSKRCELAAAARAKKPHLCHLCKKVFASKQGLEVHQQRKICGPEAQKLKESVRVQKLKESVSVNTICCQCSSSNLLFCLNLTFIC